MFLLIVFCMLDGKEIHPLMEVPTATQLTIGQHV